MPSGSPSSGRVVWLTGLPGSGKSTVAAGARQRLLAGGVPTVLLDGDALRAGLSQGLGFSREGRREAVRRAACVAAILAEQGFTVLVALVSPYAEDRAEARRLAAPHRFVEVWVDAPLETCRARDPKGHYRRADRGQLAGFTGVDDPYEPPAQPELHLDTASGTAEQAIARLLVVLGVLGA